MENIDKVLGSNKIALEVLNHLNDNKIARITGPSGSGKTHISLMIGALWQVNGGQCVIATGDQQHQSRQFYPLLTGLVQMPSDWKGFAKKGSETALKIVDLVSGSGGIAGSVFDVLKSSYKKKAEKILKTFSSVEQEILLDICTQASKTRVLLIADNIHWWDESSLQLLCEILSEQLSNSFSELSSLSLLVVDTINYQAYSETVALSHLLQQSINSTWTTHYCCEKDFPIILREFGLKSSLPLSLIQALHTATGGHLKLIEQLVEYLKIGNVQQLKKLSSNSFFSFLLDARLDALGAIGKQISQLLSFASIIGIKFHESEIKCMMEKDQMEFTDLLNKAQELKFLEVEAEYSKFSHEIFRSHFIANQTNFDLRSRKYKLAQCLLLLRPSDYETRSILYLEAGEKVKSQELHVLSLISKLRKGFSSKRILKILQRDHPNNLNIYEYMEKIIMGYDAISKGVFHSSIPMLKTPTSGETLLMAAERNYLIALCSVELQTSEGFQEAKLTLETWQSEIQEEPEIYTRYLLLLQQVYVLLELFDDARKLEKKIEQRLIGRSRFDSEATVMLQIQNRRSAAINSPEVVEIRTKESVNYFIKGTGDSVRDDIELYKALTNLSAIQIRLGKYSEAYKAARKSEQIAIKSLNIPRLDVLAGNLVLAGYRCGELSINDVITRQTEIIDSLGLKGDHFLHKCNLVSYYFLAGKKDKAEKLLTSLENKIIINNYSETYLLYYTRVLRISLSALRKTKDFECEFNDFNNFVNGLNWPAAPYLRKRLELFRTHLPDIISLNSANEQDIFLIKKYPFEIGFAWDYYSRVFPCCELSFWLDS